MKKVILVALIILSACSKQQTSLVKNSSVEDVKQPPTGVINKLCRKGTTEQGTVSIYHLDTTKQNSVIIYLAYVKEGIVDTVIRQTLIPKNRKQGYKLVAGEGGIDCEDVPVAYLAINGKNVYNIPATCVECHN